MTVFAKKVARAIGKSVNCKRVGIAVVGLEVPHAHIHLIPINNLGDIDFARPKLKFTPEEFQATAIKIKATL
jgi:histidine triad (HIT) family protein